MPPRSSRLRCLPVGSLRRPEVMARLRVMVRTRGSAALVARQLGVSPQIICDVLAGRRRPTTRLLRALGLQLQLIETYAPVRRRSA